MLVVAVQEPAVDSATSPLSGYADAADCTTRRGTQTRSRLRYLRLPVLTRSAISSAHGSRSLLQSTGTAALNAWRRDAGGDSSLVRDLRDFCQFSMESWALEAVCEFTRSQSMAADMDSIEDPRHGAHMGQQWKLAFENTKRLCNRLLLLLDTPQHAFRMAEAYLDFEGLVQATNMPLTHCLAGTGMHRVRAV